MDNSKYSRNNYRWRKLSSFQFPADNKNDWLQQIAQLGQQSANANRAAFDDSFYYEVQ